MTEAAGKLWLQSRLQAQTEKPSVGPARLALGVDSTPSSVLCGSHGCGVVSQPQPSPKVQTQSDAKNPTRGMRKPDRLPPAPTPRTFPGDLGQVVRSQGL